jgi:hypothetical protein
MNSVNSLWIVPRRVAQLQRGRYAWRPERNGSTTMVLIAAHQFSGIGALPISKDHRELPSVPSTETACIGIVTQFDALHDPPDAS